MFTSSGLGLAALVLSPACGPAGFVLALVVLSNDSRYSRSDCKCAAFAVILSSLWMLIAVIILVS